MQPVCIQQSIFTGPSYLDLRSTFLWTSVLHSDQTTSHNLSFVLFKPTTRTHLQSPFDDPFWSLVTSLVFFTISFAPFPDTLFWWFASSLLWLVDSCRRLKELARLPSQSWSRATLCCPTAHGGPHQPELGGSQLRYWAPKKARDTRHVILLFRSLFWVNDGPLPDQQWAYNAVTMGDDAVPLKGSRLLILLKPGVTCFP